MTRQEFTIRLHIPRKRWGWGGGIYTGRSLPLSVQSSPTPWYEQKDTKPGLRTEEGQRQLVPAAFEEGRGGGEGKDRAVQEGSC